MKILLVDDDLEILKGNARLLKSHDPAFEISQALDIHGALFHIRSAIGKYTPFDLVITDLNMREKNEGMDLFRALKEKSLMKGMKVVLHCAYPSTQTTEEALELGAVAVIPKGQSLLEELERLKLIGAAK